MGFLAKIKGFRGIPDWVSGTVKNLVINSDGEVFQKEGGTPFLETVSRNTTSVGNYKSSSYLEVEGLSASLESGKTYLINVYFELEVKGISVEHPDAAGYKIKIEFDGTYTHIYNDFPSEVSSPMYGESVPATKGFVKEFIIKTTSSGTITVWAAQHTTNTDQNVNWSTNNRLIVRELT